MKLPVLLRPIARRMLTAGTERSFATGLPIQAGALPWRWSDEAGLEFLLVTGRRSRRWLVPKGWPIKGKSLPEAAAQEAFEEAGVRGHVETKPLGHFRHTKNHPIAGPIAFTILVFPLEVSEDLQDWPERGQRSRRWFTRAEALAAVQSVDLQILIGDFELKAASGSP